MTLRYCHYALISALLALAVLAMGCDPIGDQAQPKVRIATWWRTRAETDAKNYLLETIQSEYSVNFEDITPGDKDDRLEWVRDSFTAREGLVPHSFLANLGLELSEWAAPNRNMLAELPAGVIDWESFHPKLDLQMADTRPYAVPVTIHQENVIFLNEDLFLSAHLDRFIADSDLSDSAGMEAYLEDFTVDKLLEVCMAFKLALATPPDDGALDGVDKPIALGGAGWELALVALENLLISRFGAREFENVFTGGGADGDSVVQTLEDLARLLICTDHPKLNWKTATRLFADGQSPLLVMGDWARGELWSEANSAASDNAAGDGEAEPDLGFNWRTFSMVHLDDNSNAHKLFVYSGDIFPMVRGLDAQPEVRTMLQFMAQPDTQIEFARRKGGIPATALTESQAERLRDHPSSSQQGTLAAFSDSGTEAVLATSGRTSTAVERLIGAAFEDFARQLKEDPPPLYDSEGAALPFDAGSDWRFELLAKRLRAYGRSLSVE